MLTPQPAGELAKAVLAERFPAYQAIRGERVRLGVTKRQLARIDRAASKSNTQEK